MTELTPKQEQAIADAVLPGVRIVRVDRDNTVKDKPNAPEPRPYWYLLTHVETGQQAGTQWLCRIEPRRELQYMLGWLVDRVARALGVLND